MIDAHCHLQFKAFEKDYDKVITDAFSNGITKIINVGTSIDSSKKAVEFAEKYENLFAIIGIHPHHADKPEKNYLQNLEKMAKSKKVLAIGEIGLDYYSYKSNGIVDPILQKKIFIEQIELAHELKLPLQIHNRHAGEDVIKVLKEHKHLLLSPPGMFHCFAGSREVLKAAIQMGFYIGFDGNITYKGLSPGESVTLSELAKLTPIERIIVETDSPYLTPIPFRGTRNEPKHAIITARFLSQIKGVPFEKLVEQTDKNINTIFRI